MPKNQFDRYALSYSKNRDVQDEIAKKLLARLQIRDYRKIIDIGCGDGALFESCSGGQEIFLGVDASRKMCDLHEKRGGCVVMQGDFDDSALTDKVLDCFGRFDLLLSSSALQWSKDIGSSISSLSGLSDKFAISVFTRGTFSSVRKFLGVDSFLPTSSEFERAIADFTVDDFWVESFKKEFESPKEAVRYIKYTGVSGGGNKISYQEAKRLYESGPKTLEFEVAYAVGSFVKSDFSTS